MKLLDMDALCSQSLEKFDFIQKVSVEHDDKESMLSIHVRGDQEIRGVLTRHLVEQGSLIEFQEQSLGLEEIFSQVIRHEH